MLDNDDDNGIDSTTSFIIYPILIFHLGGLMEFIGEVLSIAQFCNLGNGDIFGVWDLGEIETYSSSGM